MILKVKAANERAEASWRYFDGVKGLHYSIYAYSHLAWGGIVANDVQEIHFMKPRICAEEGDVNGYGETLEMCFYSETTGAIHVYSNTEVYLLNDTGKTIERLI